MNSDKMGALAVIVILVFCVVALGPLALIWAINTLFDTGIEYTFATWAASLIIGGIVGARNTKS